MGKKKFKTGRQRDLFRRLCLGQSLTFASKKAGYSSPQAGYQSLRGHRERIETAMAEAGLTDEGLIHKYLKPALSAKETKFATFEGEFTDQKNVIAWGPRLDALDIAFKIAGSYAPKEFSGPENTPLFPQVIDTGGMRGKKKASPAT